MKFIVPKKIIIKGLVSGLIVAGGLVIFAFVRTRNKTDIEFSLHINEKLVRESTFGESPTFAIWIEDTVTGLTRTIFVTNRAGTGDWEGKKAVPVALPKWFEVNAAEKQANKSTGNKIPDHITITGATPKPGYFSTRVRVKPGSSWTCWIEVNLAGDFNETYKEYDEVAKTSDEYKTGQPALLYKASITANVGTRIVPEIAGMSLLNDDNRAVIEPLRGITTATGILDEITISAVRPKPRIIEW